MACVAVTSLVRTLELEFLQPQPRPIVLENELLISGNEELIQSLREKLELLMEKLDENRMDDIEAIKDLEAKLRDVAFRVEDEIEFQVAQLYMDKAVQHRRKLGQIFHRALVKPCLRLRLHRILQQATKDIDHIKEKLVKVKNDYKHAIDLQGSRTTVGVLPKSEQVIMMGDSSQHASHSKDIMVGKNDEFETIMEWLIKHPSKQRKVVSIKGMGGIGKTTLAKRVYEDSLIAFHFDKKVWIVSTQHHDKRQMLEDLLNLKDDARRKIPLEDLALHVYKGLKGQRYLVVMDDVWSKEAWDSVKACFPDDRNGSRILLTTRLEEVANYVGSNNDFAHQMQLLDQRESWDVFCENVFLRGISQGHEFEMIGRRIVEKCRGLPLAIVVAAGLFSKLNTIDEWKFIARVQNSLATTTIVESCSRILSLSYNHLPHKLKACFLYLGVFPEDKEIYANDIARLWFAEGFVKAFENESFEVTAQRQIQELKDRNLIVVSQKSSNGRKIKAFKMHDLLHAFCVREAQNQNLLKVAHKNSSILLLKDFRWLSIIGLPRDGGYASSSSKNCRSIFCFYGLSEMNWQNFNVLRVLYAPILLLPRVNFVLSVHLRYLSSTVVKIPNSKPFSLSPWNLQTLNARSDSYCLDFPRLCYYSESRMSCPYPPKFVHQNLQGISGLILSQCTKELFTNTPYLKKVHIATRLESTVNCIGCVGNLAYLQQLESLKLCDNYKGFEYPIINQIAFFKTLKKLSFFCKGFQWKEINLLSTLPMLEVLKLGGYACEGGKWELREEGKFCQLIFLKFDVINLEHWEVSSDNFPKLERLLLYKCYYLKKIPSSFAEISTLKSIELSSCLFSVVTSAKQIQEEQHDQGNNNMVVIEKPYMSLVPAGSFDWKYEHKLIQEELLYLSKMDSQMGRINL